jgi:hypothetical protein
MGFLEVGGAVDFRDYLKRKCREQNISLHRLAVRCDLNQIYFYQAVNKNKENPPPWVLRRAAPHLGVTYVELLIAAGHLTEAELREYGIQPPKPPEKEREREREKVGV